MQTPKFPYDKSRMFISQYFHAGHKAWDIVPLYKRSDGLPADCYPIFAGFTVSMQDTSPKLGKGIKVRTNLWPDIQKHLAENGAVGKYIDILYWHLLDVTDEDGSIDQNTSVGITGNTGKVFTGGVAVPNSEKGIPPYKGLHLHLAIMVGAKYIDPQIIFNYKPQMSQIKTQSLGASRRLILEAGTIEEWIALCKVYGTDPNIVDEKVKLE